MFFLKWVKCLKLLYSAQLVALILCDSKKCPNLLMYPCYCQENTNRSYTRIIIILGSRETKIRFISTTHKEWYPKNHYIINTNVNFSYPWDLRKVPSGDLEMVSKPKVPVDQSLCGFKWYNVVQLLMILFQCCVVKHNK